MNIFCVGGAVRDRLLGYPHHETDWVVVGSTPDEMIKNGFTQVGRDFPVFLHPESKEEYALARTERKSGPGYHGFVVHVPTIVWEGTSGARDFWEGKRRGSLWSRGEGDLGNHFICK